MVHLGMQMLAPMEGGVLEGPQHTQGMVGGMQPVLCPVVVMSVVVMGPMEQQGGTISHRVGQAGELPLALISLRILLVKGLLGQHSGAEVASCAGYRVDYVPCFFLLADQYIGCCSFYCQAYSLMLYY